MGDESSSSELPISWDEAREIAIVVLIGSAALMLASPIVGWFDPRIGGTFADDVAMITSNVGSSTGIMLIGAGVLVATTPRHDVVPALRRAVVILASIAVLMGVVAIVNQMVRTTGSGFAGRLQVIFGRSGPGTMLAATARWLALRVIPFDD